MLFDSVAMEVAPAASSARGAHTTVEESAHVLHHVLVGLRVVVTWSQNFCRCTTMFGEDGHQQQQNVWGGWHQPGVLFERLNGV